MCLPACLLGIACWVVPALLVLTAWSMLQPFKSAGIAADECSGACGFASMSGRCGSQLQVAVGAVVGVLTGYLVALLYL